MVCGINCVCVRAAGQGGGVQHHEAAERVGGVRGREPGDHARAGAEAAGARRAGARAAERPAAGPHPLPRRRPL